ncbi:phage baseplate assembly protein V [Parasalinivibrio latis]|uniref:phage baseplate assembly protein V n=1 Tax=Parasalinivibrio latis TaxID=2952610 RepID=UPI0030E3545F
MNEKILQRLAELERRLANLLMTGQVADVDYPSGYVKVAAGALTTTWLPWVTHRAGPDVSFWAPEVGEQVMVLSPCGEPELGVVLPAIYQNLYPHTDQRETVKRVQFADGADMSYDRARHALAILLPPGATTTLIAQGGITVEGNVTVKGNIKATGDITDKTRSMQADRVIYNGHRHLSPETGAKTSEPGAQQ